MCQLGDECKENCMKKIVTCIIIGVVTCCLFTACKQKSKTYSLAESNDWEKEVLRESSCAGWGNPIVENNQYAFFSNVHEGIIRVDKRDKSRKVIVKLGKPKKSSYRDVALLLSKKQLYYVYDFSVYRCDLDGKNIKRIVSSKDVIKDGESDTLWGAKFYHDKLYLMLAGNVIKYDISLGKSQVVAKEISSGDFYGNGFFYVDADTAIYKVDLQSNKRKLVRGKPWKKGMKASEFKMYFQSIMTIDGQLYYTRSQGEEASEGGEPSDIYLYQKDGKDLKKYSASTDLHEVVVDQNKIVYTDIDKEGKSVLKLYDISKNEELKVKIPDGAQEILQFIDGLYVYFDSENRCLVYKTDKYKN